jgi:hypothetical protein
VFGVHVPLLARERPSNVVLTAFGRGDDHSYVASVSAQASQEPIKLLV